MAFKVNANRRDDGGYDLSFGKGRNKLIGVLTSENGKWSVDDFDQEKTKREALAAWASWAVANYRGSGAAPASLKSATPEAPNRATPGVESGDTTAHNSHSGESWQTVLADVYHMLRDRYTPDNPTTLWMEGYIERLKPIVGRTTFTGESDADGKIGTCPPGTACGRRGSTAGRRARSLPADDETTGKTSAAKSAGPPSYPPKVEAAIADDSSANDGSELEVSGI